MGVLGSQKPAEVVRLGRGKHSAPTLEENMFEVTFWRDGVEKTIADKFDTMQDALDYAREGVEYREHGKYWYDEALILDTEDYSTTFVTRTGVSGTF